MAIDYNGTTQYSQVTTPITAAPLTMACWFNSDNITTQQYLMSIANYSGGSSGHFFGLVAAGSVVGDPIQAATYAGSTVNATTTTGYSINTWHHAAAVFASPTSRAAYIDGGSKGIDTNSRTPSGLSYLGIGTVIRSDNPPTKTNGRIAEAGLWNVALTDGEIATLATGISPLAIRPQSLIGYWPLVGRNSSPIDLANGKTLTSFNSPPAAAHPRVLKPATSWSGFAQPLQYPETGFDLQWDNDGSFVSPTTISIGANETFYGHSGLPASTPFYYRIRSKNSYGVSDWSATATATTDATNNYILQEDLFYLLQEDDASFLLLEGDIIIPSGIPFMRHGLSGGMQTLNYGGL